MNSLKSIPLIFFIHMQNNHIYKNHTDSLAVIPMTCRDWFKVSVKKTTFQKYSFCHGWQMACANVHLKRGQRVFAHLGSTGMCTVQPHNHYNNHWCKATPSIKQTPLIQPRSRYHQLSWLSLTNRTVCCPPLDAISTVRFSSCLPVTFTGLHSSSSSPVPSCMLVPIPQEYTEPATTCLKGIKTRQDHMAASYGGGRESAITVKR